MPDYSTYSEDELLQLLKGNDEQAFTEIYNRYWEKLLAIGYYYLHYKQGAEDIVQEVLISLWKRRKELAIQSLQAYLATAVKFAVFKAIVREKKRRERSATQAPLDDSNETEKNLDARFLQEYLHQLTKQLPEKTRLVFAYREEKITVNEIAVRTNLSPKAVEYHVTKALRALREGLKKIKLFFV
jgi:RNA polymerase sigma-70 factor (ECF subfamily)